jgi:two-component system alkaline phosphatase synthesis response regulator PhoP
MENESFRILLVDDEPDILEILSYNLRREGYQIATANNGKEAVKTALQFLPHLVILDVMMPDLDGIETLKEIRTHESLQHTLVCFLTARGEDYSQIAGFEAGADDYISKPLRPRVLMSRVAALLRRFPQDKPKEQVIQDVIRVSNLVIDRDAYVVTQNDVQFHLPKKEFELLYLLAGKPGKVFSREKILKKVWGDEVVVGDRTIDVHIRKLREKIGDSCIKTVKGVGYKFEW